MPGGGGGGGSLIAPSGRVFAPFGYENRHTLCPFWSGIGYGFGGNYGIDGIVWTSLSFQFQKSKKERKCQKYANSKWIEEFWVCLRSNIKIYVMITKVLPKGQVWKQVWILEVWSENECGKLYFLLWNRFRNWRTGRHTPTKNSQEYPPGK